MEAPTLGLTILIILVFTIISQLLLQGSRNGRRYRELKEQLDRIERRLPG